MPQTSFGGGMLLFLSPYIHACTETPIIPYVPIAILSASGLSLSLALSLSLSHTHTHPLSPDLSQDATMVPLAPSV